MAPEDGSTSEGAAQVFTVMDEDTTLDEPAPVDEGVDPEF